MKKDRYFYPAINKNNVSKFIYFLEYNKYDNRILQYIDRNFESWERPILLCLDKYDTPCYMYEDYTGCRYYDWERGEDYYIKNKYEKITWDAKITFNLY